MKLKPVFLVFSFAILLCSQCRKHTAEQLPPATQTGEGTLGFTINGKIYKANFPDAKATYIYLNFPYPYSSGYFLNITGEKMGKWYLGMFGDSLKIYENNTYPLNNYRSIPGTEYGKFSDFQKEFYTKPYLSGELKISKIDSINQIVSGTFWFDAKDTISNTTVSIRDGRFDLHYTQ